MTGPRFVDTYVEELRPDGLFVQRGSEILSAFCHDCDWHRSHGAAISGLTSGAGAICEADAAAHVREAHHQVSINRELALISPGKADLELVR